MTPTDSVLIPTPLVPRAVLRLRSLLPAALRVFLATAILSVILIGFFPYDFRAAHFVYLADSFAHGTLAVDALPNSYSDVVTFNGHLYLPLGPLPGLLLAPVALIFGHAFSEYPFTLLAAALSVLALNGVLKRLSIQAEQRKWLLALFFCGTLYLAALVQGNSWFLSHVLSVLLLLVVIWEMLGQRRMPLVGLCLGGAFLTRSTTVLGVVFVLLLLWRDRELTARRLALLALGFAPAFLFFTAYNFARFGSPFETGYALARVNGRVLTEALSYGLFSPVHIPKNLYMLFLAMPQPVPDWSAPVLRFPYVLPSAWGMGILFTTPAFVYAARARLEWRTVAAWFTVLVILVPLLLYYGVGWIQFGYRYALDFYPFLFIPTALAIAARWSWKAQTLIVLCLLINIWGAWCTQLGWFVMWQ